MNFVHNANVVVPVDFSEESFAALEQARSMVSDPATISVVHVLPEIYPGESGVPFGAVDDEKRIASVQEALSKRLNGEKCYVRIGTPWLEIVRLAESLDASLIVMSTYGRTGLARLGMGSYAELVVRLAPCSVLVLRDKDEVASQK